MGKMLIVLSLLVGQAAWAAVPDPVITTYYPDRGYAMVAGRLQSRPTKPVGITARNGNCANCYYSSMTDAEGRWAIVVQYRTVDVEVTSWDVSKPASRSRHVTATVPMGTDDEKGSSASLRTGS